MNHCFFDHCTGNRLRGVSRRRVVISVVFLGFVLWLLFLVQDGKVAYFEVDSASMAPTIMPGDRLISAQPSHGYHLGDLVVFESPVNPNVMAVKRLVAKYPDEVILRKGLLFINGQSSPYDSLMYPSDDLPDQTWPLEPGQVFVAGDNRQISLDSRSYGPLRFDALRGVIIYRTGPPDRRGSLR